MKFKQIPDEYYISIIDKLTRLEPAYIRYQKVFDDVINKFLLSDKLKNLSKEDETKIALQIINHNTQECNTDKYLRNALLQQEESSFIINSDSLELINLKINFFEILKKIENIPNLPKNIKWLITLANNQNKDIIKLREEKNSLYPIEKIILCEGQTEYTLLEPILNKLGYDINKYGILIIPSGGKNQVARKFYEMIEYTKLPFFILLDKDATQTKELILPKLRNNDKIYLINSGEFEDIIPKEILIETINTFHSNDLQCNITDFEDDLPMAKNLALIYKKYGYGDFKKAEFSKQLKDYIEKTEKIDFSNSEIQKILISLQG